MFIVHDESSTPAGRKTIISWQGRTLFGGRGFAGDGVDVASRESRESWKKRQIETAIAEFSAGNPGTRAGDYFLSLGMTCMPAIAASKDGVTRCEIELPIRIECSSTNMFFPGGVPVPKELRGPIPALLRTSVDVSTSTLLDVSTRIDPIPGGHLCHR